MCALLGVPRSTYYAWAERAAGPQTATAARRAMLAEQIQLEFTASRSTSGCRRIAAALNQRGIDASVGLVADLMRELGLRAVQPRVVVCLGATAAQALLGPQARVGTAAAPVASPWAPSTLVTYHPSAVLRARDDESRKEMRVRLVHDLRLAGELAAREE